MRFILILTSLLLTTQSYADSSSTNEDLAVELVDECRNQDNLASLACVFSMSQLDQEVIQQLLSDDDWLNYQANKKALLDNQQNFPFKSLIGRPKIEFKVDESKRPDFQ